MSTETQTCDQVEIVIEDDVMEVEVLPEWLAKETTSLEKDLMSLDQVFDRASDRRERLIQKIEPVIDSMEISLGGDPEKLEAQSNLISTYSKLLNDAEDNSYKRASIKLRKKQEENVNNMGGSIAQLLQSIDMRGTTMAVPLTQEEQQRILDNQFESRGCMVIADSEKEMDPTGVHHLSAILRDEAEQAHLDFIQQRKNS